MAGEQVAAFNRECLAVSLTANPRPHSAATNELPPVGLWGGAATSPRLMPRSTTTAQWELRGFFHVKYSQKMLSLRGDWLCNRRRNLCLSTE